MRGVLCGAARASACGASGRGGSFAYSRFAYTRFRLETSYESRVGHRAHVEVEVPAETVGSVAGRVAGLADVSVGGRYVVHADAAARVPWIVAAGLTATLPTGSRQSRFGEGAPFLEPYLALGTVPGKWYVQAELRGGLPLFGVGDERLWNVVYNVSVSRDLTAVPGAWAAGVEMNGFSRSLAVTPEVRMRLTRTGTLAGLFGVRIPVASAYFPEFTRWTAGLVWEYRAARRRP